MFWGLHSIYLWMAEHAHVCNKYIEYRLSFYTIVGPCVALKSANSSNRLSCIEIRVFVAEIGNSSEADFLALKAILVGVF